jgi:hypothetical protein
MIDSLMEELTYGIRRVLDELGAAPASVYAGVGVSIAMRERKDFEPVHHPYHG